MKAPFYKSVGYALSGIIDCMKKERNIKIHVVIMLIVIICGIEMGINKNEWIICLILFGNVIALELLNTAIEAIVDLASPQYHTLAKYAKDVSAGAVLIMAFFAAVIGMMIFLPKLFSLL